MKLNDAYLSRREQQIVELLLQHDRLTANEIVQLLPDQPSNSAVRTFLTILEQKGHVAHTKSGKEFVYFVATEREQAAQSALQSVVRTFFQGSVGSAVAALVGDHVGALSPDEIDKLQSLIDAARLKKEDPS